MTSTNYCHGWGVILLALLAGRVDAGEPVLRSLNLHGLQIGGTTPLVIDGDELGNAPRLLLPCSVRQESQKGSTDKQARFDVTLTADVPPGYYPLRVVTDHGVSLPLVIGVDRLPQRPLTTAVEQLPVALHGTVGGSATVEAKFAGKAGQKVQVEVEAQRLGSKLRPVVHLYSPKRLQLAWAWDQPALFGDARLEATLPEDGTYTIALHDAEYAAGGPGFFRLKLGSWSAVEQVFPPAVARGQPAAIELLGPSPPARVDLPAQPAVGAVPLLWPKDGAWSGPRPFVRVSSHAEVVGQPAGEKPQELPAGPVGVSGRLLTPYAEDRYRVPVTPGSKVRLEVFAERYGSPLDVALVVRNDKGDALARAEDSPGSLDPVLEYAVPANVTAVVVGVVDAQGRGGPRGVYRLTITPQPSAGKGDMRLFTPAQRIALPIGGAAVVPVLVEGRGYPGSITLTAAGLPAGAVLEGATIPAEADGALVTVRRGLASGGAVITTWRGRGADGEERAVTIKDHPLARLQPWLATELPLVPTAEKAADFQIDWRGLPADAGLVPARKLSLPVKVTRPAENSVVKLTLLTSQNPPLANNQPDPNKSLRLEKAVELGPKTADGDLTLLAPPELPAPSYDVTVQAELLSPDKRIVKAVAFAPVRRLAVRLPVVVKLDGPARIEAVLDPKKETTVKLQGQVERREGLTGDVALAVTGLPPGARADAVTVKAGATAFTVSVVLSPTLPAGDIRGLKLSGSGAPDAKQPNVRVRSREVQVTIIVRAAK
jgi:hypothetical protein